MPPKAPAPELLLFDIGGVIIRWVGIEELSKLTEISIEQTKDRFADSVVFQEFERGLTDADTFMAEFQRLFDLGKCPTPIVKLWNSWVQQPYDGVEVVLKSLRQEYKTACLSNTNALHWEHLNGYFDCKTHFDHAYASHEIHQAKPDAASYEFVLQDLGVAPEQVLFFDDTQANVNAAQILGMTAYKINPEHGVLPTLKALSII